MKQASIGKSKGASVTFWGAAQAVSGSMHLVEAADLRVLLDCGLVLGASSHAQDRNRNFPFAPTSLSAVVLSHAHIDHLRQSPESCASGIRRADLLHARHALAIGDHAGGFGAHPRGRSQGRQDHRPPRRNDDGTALHQPRSPAHVAAMRDGAVRPANANSTRSPGAFRGRGSPPRFGDDRAHHGHERCRRI